MDWLILAIIVGVLVGVATAYLIFYILSKKHKEEDIPFYPPKQNTIPQNDLVSSVFKETQKARDEGANLLYQQTQEVPQNGNQKIRHMANEDTKDRKHSHARAETGCHIVVRYEQPDCQDHADDQTDQKVLPKPVTTPNTISYKNIRYTISLDDRS